MIVVSDPGLSYMMEVLRLNFNSSILRLHLYQNNVTPDRNTVLAAFTEATFDGYLPANINSFALSVVGGHIAVSQPINTVFTKSSGTNTNSIYGYYITNQANNTLLWSERDTAAPFVMSVTGTQYSVQLLMSAQNLAGVP